MCMQHLVSVDALLELKPLIYLPPSSVKSAAFLNALGRGTTVALGSIQ